MMLILISKTVYCYVIVATLAKGKREIFIVWWWFFGGRYNCIVIVVEGILLGDQRGRRLWLDACVRGVACRVVKEMVADVGKRAVASRT